MKRLLMYGDTIRRNKTQELKNRKTKLILVDLFTDLEVMVLKSRFGNSEKSSQNRIVGLWER